MKIFIVTIFVINSLYRVSLALDAPATSGRENNRSETERRLVAFPHPRKPGRKLDEYIYDIPDVDFTLYFDENSEGKVCSIGCEGDYSEIFEAIENMEAQGKGYAFFFKVKGNYAIGVGQIKDHFPERVNDMIAKNPQVHTLILVSAPGSDVSDTEVGGDSALKGSRLIYQNKISTCVPSDGNAESGGTDLFLAGYNRYASPGAKIGIHSWVDSDGTIGTETPKDHPDHTSYLNYFEEICIPGQFYWESLKHGVPMYYVKENEYETTFPYMRDCNYICDYPAPNAQILPNPAPIVPPTPNPISDAPYGYDYYDYYDDYAY